MQTVQGAGGVLSCFRDATQHLWIAVSKEVPRVTGSLPISHFDCNSIVADHHSCLQLTKGQQAGPTALTPGTSTCWPTPTALRWLPTAFKSIMAASRARGGAASLTWMPSTLRMLGGVSLFHHFSPCSSTAMVLATTGAADNLRIKCRSTASVHHVREAFGRMDPGTQQIISWVGWIHAIPYG